MTDDPQNPWIGLTLPQDVLRSIMEALLASIAANADRNDRGGFTVSREGRKFLFAYSMISPHVEPVDDTPSLLALLNELRPSEVPE